MRKVNALIKYEFTNFKRGKLIWITAALYLFGIQQVISSMFSLGNNFLSVVGLIKVSWLPLNFIMVPLLLIGMNVGQSSNEIFEAMDISNKEMLISKLLVMSIIDGFLMISNIIILIIIGILSKVSLNYFLYLSLGYIINTIIFLLATSSIGLFVGQIISKHLSDIVGFISILLIFILLCNFYRTSMTIIPLIDIRTFPGVFDVISYDKGYLYHNLFWLFTSLILILIPYTYVHMKNRREKKLGLHIAALTLASICCIYAGISTFLTLPKFYNITSRRDSSGISSEEKTFYNDKSSPYYIDKYDMRININDALKNNCTMEIKIKNSNIKSFEFGLCESLKISKVKVDGQEVNFKRTKNSFIISTQKQYKTGDSINIKVSYEGKIDAIWTQGMKLFYVRNNSFFLADVFEWYPKLNDGIDKEYDVSIKYAGKNKIYSNLDEVSSSGQYKFEGTDNEIFLLSGNLSERKYKGYLFIGNEEYINNDSECNDIIDYSKKNNYSTNKIVLSPFIPGITKMDKPYEKSLLFPLHN